MDELDNCYPAPATFAVEGRAFPTPNNLDTSRTPGVSTKHGTVEIQSIRRGGVTVTAADRLAHPAVAVVTRDKRLAAAAASPPPPLWSFFAPPSRLQPP